MESLIYRIFPHKLWRGKSTTRLYALFFFVLLCNFYAKDLVFRNILLSLSPLTWNSGVVVTHSHIGTRRRNLPHRNYFSKVPEAFMMRIIKVVSICFLMILASTTVHANVFVKGDGFNWGPVMDAIIQLESKGNAMAVNLVHTLVCCNLPMSS